MFVHRSMLIHPVFAKPIERFAICNYWCACDRATMYVMFNTGERLLCKSRHGKQILVNVTHNNKLNMINLEGKKGKHYCWQRSFLSFSICSYFHIFLLRSYRKHCLSNAGLRGAVLIPPQVRLSARLQHNFYRLALIKEMHHSVCQEWGLLHSKTWSSSNKDGVQVRQLVIT